jgi:hypothetical protein
VRSPGATKSQDDDDDDTDYEDDSDESLPPPLPPRISRGKPLPSNRSDDADEIHNHNGLTGGMGNGSVTSSSANPDKYDAVIDDSQCSEGLVIMK